jgi:hypothetical protein
MKDLVALLVGSSKKHRMVFSSGYFFERQGKLSSRILGNLYKISILLLKEGILILING